MGHAAVETGASAFPPPPFNLAEVPRHLNAIEAIQLPLPLDFLFFEVEWNIKQ